MPNVTIHAELLDYYKDIDGYTTLVFKNLEHTTWTNKYIMCTKVPNWDSPQMKINDTGYLTYKEVIAGVDKWFDEKLQIMKSYRYDSLYFIDFVPDNKKEKSDYVL